MPEPRESHPNPLLEAPIATPRPPDYPSETLRVLKEKNICQFGEYCAGRLVLEAWDRMVEANGDFKVMGV